MISEGVSRDSATQTTPISVGFLCHDFRKDSGRGIDRYSYYLGTNLRKYVDLHLVQVGKIKRYPKDWLARVWKYPLAARAINADVYHATSYLDGSVAIMAKRRPLVTTIHDLLPLKSSEKDYHPSRFPIKDGYESYCIKASMHSDLIITPFKSYVSDIVSDLNYPRDRIRQIYYGVDHDFFQPGDKDKDITRKILYVGGINKEKGIFDLVFVLQNLRRSLDNLTLVVGGRGPDLELLRRVVSEHNLTDCVKLLGFVQEVDLPQLYRSVDLLVVPAKTGFSLMSLEAMSCGTPALVGDTPDNREIIENNGLRCEIGNSEDLEGKVFDALSDEKSVMDLSAQAISVSSNYSWKRMATETNSVYMELCK
jgi:glycosyltransferase involved in cell wall biosynthesis